MGQVFLARDTMLDREVAVKVLSSPNPLIEEVARFEREAKALAALDHPNIGLANIRRPDRQPGEKRLASVRLTAPGWVVGTLGYMAPEQVRGELIDQRADLFAVGAVLFEMLTGAPAFDAETTIGALHAVLEREPPLSVLDEAGVPRAFSDVVRRCLEKVPAHRFQSARELADALENVRGQTEWGSAPTSFRRSSGIMPANRRTSVAVLPFNNVSADADMEYFSDGVTEDVINALTQIDGLYVAEEAIRETRRAVELDPMATLPAYALGLVYIGASQFEDAVRCAEAVLERDPAQALMHRVLGLARSFLGQYPEAIAAMERGVELTTRPPFLVAELGVIRAAAGEIAEATQLHEELLERARTTYISPMAMGAIPFALGDHEEGFRNFALAFERREPNVIPTTLWPTYGALREDPRAPVVPPDGGDMAGVTGRPLLERVSASPINYWATFVTDLVVAASFAWFGATRYAGSGADAAAIVLIGIVGWPLLEYVLHRWLLHGSLSAMFRKEHARHHGHPRETAGTPWLASASLGVVLWAGLAVVLSGSTAALVMSGVYTGYIYFVIVHRMQHYHPDILGRWWFFGKQMRVHELHHEQPDMDFGITTAIWDRVFGTFSGRSRFLEHDEVVMEQPRR